MYGKVVRNYRERQGYQQEEFARLIDMPAAAYNKLELGKRGLSFDEARRIATTLRLSLDVLAGLETPPLPPCAPKVAEVSEKLQALAQELAELASN